jgi:hypothetical protein
MWLSSAKPELFRGGEVRHLGAEGGLQQAQTLVCSVSWQLLLLPVAALTPAVLGRV